MTILIDCDGVLADLAGTVLRKINARLETEYTYDQLTAYEMSAALNVDQSEIDSILGEEGFCSSLPIRPGAKDFIQWVRGIYGVPYIVTSPWSKSKYWMYERQQWLVERLAIPPSRIIHTHAKHLVKGSVLVEDKYSTLSSWTTRYRRAGVLINQPWNEDVTGGGPLVIRARNWGQVKGIIMAVLALSGKICEG